MAWTTAVLSRAKKIPPLRRLMGGKALRSQTPEEMERIARRWMAVLPGRVKQTPSAKET